MTNFLELVRRNAEQGDPPEPYFNDIPESAMKREVAPNPAKCHISARKWRRWSPSKGVYFHFQASCVRATQPHFHGGHLQIPLEAANFFTPEHHGFLRGSLGISL